MVNVRFDCQSENNDRTGTYKVGELKKLQSDQDGQENGVPSYENCAVEGLMKSFVTLFCWPFGQLLRTFSIKEFLLATCRRLH